MIRTVLQVALVGACTLGIAALAHAQSAGPAAPPAASAPVDERAEADAATAAAMAREGLEAFEAGDLAGAYDLYRAAWALVPDPNFAYNLGGLCEESGWFAEAYEWYRRYLELAPTAPDAAELRAVSEALRQRLDAEWARVVVRSEPEGATVTIERAGSTRELGVAPLETWVEPGRVTMRADLEAMLPAEDLLTLEAGSLTAWRVRLTSPGDAETSSVVADVVTDAVTDVAADGAAAPIREPAQPGEPAAADWAADPPPPRRAGGWALVGGGVALVGAGAGVFAMAADAAASHRDLVGSIDPVGDAQLGPAAIATRGDDLDRLASQTRTREGVAYTLAGVGLGALVGGAAWLARRPGDDAPRAARLTPTASGFAVRF